MSDMKITNTTSAYTASATAQKAETKTEETKKETSDVAAVYEKSDTTKKTGTNTIYNRDAIVKKLKQDQQNHVDTMQSLVESLLGKQKGTFSLANGTNLAATFREAASLASPEDIAQAKADIAEDGYWGVEQTSNRLVSMAIALTGGNTSKADEMINAIKKGFKKATNAWGEDLPQLCQDTMDATLQKMDDWKNGKTTASDYSDYLS